MVDGGKSFPIDNMLKEMDKVFTGEKRSIISMIIRIEGQENSFLLTS